MWIVWVGAALAGPPEVEVKDGGIFAGSVSVALAPDAMRAELSDPRKVAEIDGGKTQVTLGAKDGACQLADYLSPSAFLDVTYTVKRCPTPDGYQATMVTSNAFSSYGTRWRFEPEGTGTLVHYELTLVSSLRWVPDSIVNSATKSGVMRLMKALETTFGAGTAPAVAPEG